MGTKLSKEENVFLEDEEEEVQGLVAACYCCTRPTHVDYDSLDYLLTACHAEKEYHLLICVLCKEYIELITEKNLPLISYDIVRKAKEKLEKKSLLGLNKCEYNEAFIKIYKTLIKKEKTEIINSSDC